MNAREDTWAVDVKSIFTLIKFHAKSRNFIPYSRRINREESQQSSLLLILPQRNHVG